MVELNTGAKIPAVGFGTFTWEDPTEVAMAVEDALKVGRQYYNTASQLYISCL